MSTPEESPDQLEALAEMSALQTPGTSKVIESAQASEFKGESAT